MAYPTMPALTEPLVQRPHVDNISSRSHDEFVQTDSIQTERRDGRKDENKEMVDKLAQGPVTCKHCSHNPRFKPLAERDWGAL